jgi:hypothetical protein
MKHTNRYGIIPRVAIPALAVPLLFAFSSHSTAPATEPQEEVPAMPSEALASIEDLSSTGLAERIIQSSGAIEADVDEFRALLGDPNNGVTPGPLGSGRREINWDGVPAAVTNVPNFPLDFFLVNSPRGLGYDAIDPGLEVSDQRFADINPTYAAEFTPFSGQKLFSPIGNIAAVTFVSRPARQVSVRGFGVRVLGRRRRRWHRHHPPRRGRTNSAGSSRWSERRPRLLVRRAVFRDAVIEGAIIISGTERSVGGEGHQPGRPTRPRGLDDFLYG